MFGAQILSGNAATELRWSGRLYFRNVPWLQRCKNR